MMGFGGSESAILEQPGAKFQVLSRSDNGLSMHQVSDATHGDWEQLDVQEGIEEGEIGVSAQISEDAPARVEQVADALLFLASKDVLVQNTSDINNNRRIEQIDVRFYSNSSKVNNCQFSNSEQKAPY